MKIYKIISVIIYQTYLKKGYKMFHEFRDIMTKMKSEDKHFHKLFDRHNELDDKIILLEKKHTDMFEIEKYKKEKLKLKDEIYNSIVTYKKANNL